MSEKTKKHAYRTIIELMALIVILCAVNTLTLRSMSKTEQTHTEIMTSVISEQQQIMSELRELQLQMNIATQTANTGYPQVIEKMKKKEAPNEYTIRRTIMQYFNLTDDNAGNDSTTSN